VEKARDHFRRYELCRERMRKLLGKPDHEGKEE
jgi:hypothetical protein